MGHYAKWIVRLICCGREDGLYGPVYSWQEASTVNGEDKNVKQPGARFA